MSEERLSVSAAARLAGLKTDTFRAYVFRGNAPQADGIDETFGKRYWYRSTVETWMDNRPGQGARTELA
jgi:hypothetical protein